MDEKKKLKLINKKVIDKKQTKINRPIVKRHNNIDS